jgi:hypothetical protein
MGDTSDAPKAMHIKVEILKMKLQFIACGERRLEKIENE